MCQYNQRGRYKCDYKLIIKVIIKVIKYAQCTNTLNRRCNELTREI